MGIHQVTGTLAILIGCTICTAAAAGPFALHVDPQGVGRVNSPVHARLSVPDQLSLKEVEHFARVGAVLNPGMVYVHIRPVREGDKVVAADLYWVEPQLRAGQKKVYKLEEAPKTFAPIPAFAFKSVEGGLHRDLLFGASHTGVAPVYRHAMLKYDEGDHFSTYKHFHHAYTFDGKDFITNGPGTGKEYTPKGIQYPHHRGLYIGWSKTRAGGKSFDTWHCSNGVSLRHQKFVDSDEFVGPVAAREASIAHWCGGDGEPIVIEHRQVTTWNVGKGATVMDFDFTLRSAGGDVELDGDPQHAGFQFRAVNGAKAQYIYPASAQKKGGDVWAGCLWVVNQFKVGDTPVAVVHMDHPQNPGTKEGQTVYSTRNYGRFGAFAKHQLKAAEPLTFNYRIMVLDPAVHTDLSVEHFDKLHAAFVKPVRVTVGPG